MGKGPWPSAVALVVMPAPGMIKLVGGPDGPSNDLGPEEFVVPGDLEVSASGGPVVDAPVTNKVRPGNNSRGRRPVVGRNEQELANFLSGGVDDIHLLFTFGIVNPTFPAREPEVAKASTEESNGASSPRNTRITPASARPLASLTVVGIADNLNVLKLPAPPLSFMRLSMRMRLQTISTPGDVTPAA